MDLGEGIRNAINKITKKNIIDQKAIEEYLK